MTDSRWPVRRLESFAEPPEEYGDEQPGGSGQGKNEGEVVGGEAFPEDDSEGGEAEGSGGGSCGFYAGFGAGEEETAGSGFSFAPDGVGLRHAEAGGEDAGGGSEEGAGDR